jgi:hypothetical protein
MYALKLSTEQAGYSTDSNLKISGGKRRSKAETEIKQQARKENRLQKKLMTCAVVEIKQERNASTWTLKTVQYAS